MQRDSLFLLCFLALTSCQIRPASSALPPMVLVKGGTFTMGTSGTEEDGAFPDQLPAHQVTVDDFYMAKYPVTVGQYAFFVEETGYLTNAETGIAKPGDTVTGSWISIMGRDIFNHYINWRFDSYGIQREPDATDYPAIHLSWNDANAYCEWLAKKEGKPYRLPTEAEWEYAARGGRESKGYLHSGSNQLDEVAWYASNSGDTLHVVGLKKPNELGIYDMNGSIWEWCQDWYGLYDVNPMHNPQGPEEGTHRVVRGGTIVRMHSECTVNNRNKFFPYNRGSTGLRVVYSL